MHCRFENALHAPFGYSQVMLNLLLFSVWNHTWQSILEKMRDGCLLSRFRVLCLLTIWLSLFTYTLCSTGHGAPRAPISGTTGAVKGHFHLYCLGSFAATPVWRPRAGRRRGGRRTFWGTDLCGNATGQDEDMRGHIHQSPQVKQ